jgi:hypothetical protein
MRASVESQEVVPGQTEPADRRLRFNITVGASYIGTARSPALGLADLMLDRLGHKPISEAPSNEAFGLSLCFGSVRRPEDSKEGESIRPIGLPIVEYLERPSTLNVGTFVFLHPYA